MRRFIALITIVSLVFVLGGCSCSSSTQSSAQTSSDTAASAPSASDTAAQTETSDTPSTSQQETATTGVDVTDDKDAQESGGTVNLTSASGSLEGGTTCVYSGVTVTLPAGSHAMSTVDETSSDPDAVALDQLSVDIPDDAVSLIITYDITPSLTSSGYTYEDYVTEISSGNEVRDITVGGRPALFLIIRGASGEEAAGDILVPYGDKIMEIVMENSSSATDGITGAYNSAGFQQLLSSMVFS